MDALESRRWITCYFKSNEFGSVSIVGVGILVALRASEAMSVMGTKQNGTCILTGLRPSTSRLSSPTLHSGRFPVRTAPSRRVVCRSKHWGRLGSPWGCLAYAKYPGVLSRAVVLALVVVVVVIDQVESTGLNSSQDHLCSLLEYLRQFTLGKQRERMYM